MVLIIKDDRLTLSEHIHEITLTGVKVYLPVRQYEVTIRHRLLDQLGSFSRLILEALHDFEQAGYELVYSITGLACRVEAIRAHNLSPRGVRTYSRWGNNSQR